MYSGLIMTFTLPHPGRAIRAGILTQGAHTEAHRFGLSHNTDSHELGWLFAKVVGEGGETGPKFHKTANIICYPRITREMVGDNGYLRSALQRRASANGIPNDCMRRAPDILHAMV